MSNTAQNTRKTAQSNEKLTEKAGNTARNVFLANLGLYGKLYEQGQEIYKQTEKKYKQTNEKARELLGKREEIFQDLVKRGEKVQKQAFKTFEKVKTEQKEALDEGLEKARGNVDKLKETVGVNKRESESASGTQTS